jgi:hypothetical protein
MGYEGGGGLVVQLHSPSSSTLEEGVCSHRLAPQPFRHGGAPPPVTQRRFARFWGGKSVAPRGIRTPTSQSSSAYLSVCLCLSVYLSVFCLSPYLSDTSAVDYNNRQSTTNTVDCRTALIRWQSSSSFNTVKNSSLQYRFRVIS